MAYAPRIVSDPRGAGVDYSHESFENVTVELDGNTFENCDFKDVVLVYGGGQLKMQDCRMDRFSFRFTGALANGLFALYELFGTEGMLQIIRGFTEPSGTGEIELKLPKRSPPN
jgi:hypothetical protein